MKGTRGGTRQPDPPACKDCRFYWADDGLWCRNPVASTFDPVKGRQNSAATEARRERGGCGPTGDLFESRPPPTWLDRNGPPIVIGLIILGFIARSLWPW